MTLTQKLLTASATAALFGLTVTSSALATYNGGYHDNRDNKYHDNKNWDHKEYDKKSYHKDYDKKDYQENKHQYSYNWHAKSNTHDQYDKSGNDWANYDKWFSHKSYNWNHERNWEHDWNDYDKWSKDYNMNWWDKRSYDWEKNDFKSWHDDHMKMGHAQYNNWEHQKDNCQY